MDFGKWIQIAQLYLVTHMYGAGYYAFTFTHYAMLQCSLNLSIILNVSFMLYHTMTFLLEYIDRLLKFLINA